MPIRSQNFVLAKGYPVAAAITKKRAVKFVGDGTQKVTPVTAEGDMVIGVALFSVSAAEFAKGKKASVMTEGRVVMESAGAISEGAAVGIDGTGKAIAANTGARFIGICDEPCTGSGQDVGVHLDISPGPVSA